MPFFFRAASSKACLSRFLSLRLARTPTIHLFPLNQTSSLSTCQVNRNSTAQSEALDRLDAKAVLGMLTLGVDRIFSNDQGVLPTDAELDRIIDRANPERATGGGAGGGGGGAGPSASGLLTDGRVSAAAYDKGQTLMSTFSLHGQDYSQYKSLGDIAKEFAAVTTKRERTTNTVRRVWGGGGGKAVSVHGSCLFFSFHSPHDHLQRFSRTLPPSIHPTRLEYTIHSTYALLPINSTNATTPNSTPLPQVEVDGYTVLKANLYSLKDGEPSVFGREADPALREAVKNPPKRKLAKAGVDYGESNWCQVCWDGGELLCCEGCPVTVHPVRAGREAMTVRPSVYRRAFLLLLLLFLFFVHFFLFFGYDSGYVYPHAAALHPSSTPSSAPYQECIGMNKKQLASLHLAWRCPHHECGVCGRKAQDAGGLLFRCEGCEMAYCEDCTPSEMEIVGECQRFAVLSFTHPKQVRAALRCVTVARVL